MEVGQDCCEHLTGFERAVGELAGWEPPDTGPWAWFSAWTEYDKIPPDDLRVLFERLKVSGMVQCPTLVVMKSIGRAAEPDEVKQDPKMAYVPTSLRAFWSSPQYEAMGDRARETLPFMQSMVGDLHRAGITLLVGTDLANPYVFAGFAVHEEMAMFRQAGISNLDVLRAATIVPAEFCGVSDDLGTVAEGKIASMVLVDGNPLDDIANAARVRGVFLRGRHFDRDALDALLAGVLGFGFGSASSSETSCTMVTSRGT